MHKEINERVATIKMYQTVVIDKLDIIKLKKLLHDVEFKKTYAGNKLVWAALLPCGFDIETTRQFMYLWTFSIKSLTVIGYTWEDYNKLLTMLNEVLKLGVRTYTIKHRGTEYTKTVKHRDGTVETKTHHKNDGEKEDKETAPYVLPIFIHNVKFEYSYMKNEFLFNESFFMDKKNRNPLYLINDNKFFYIDSYKVFPKSLEDVAESYCSLKKLHDLDYSIDRNTEDAKHLSKEELNYCIRDTQILVEVAEFIFEHYFIPYGRLPLTQNQIVKSIIHLEFMSMPKEDREKMISWLNKQTLTQDQHWFLREIGFRGGWNDSSLIHFKGRVGYGDADSAYFSGIMHGYYPVTKFKAPKYMPKDEIDLERFLKLKCCQMLIKFYNLESKGDKLVKYESFNLKKIIRYLPNGLRPETPKEKQIMRDSVRTYKNKIWKASCIVVSINEIDFSIYKEVYEWEKMEILRIETSERGQLPDYVKQAALKLYKEKATMKKAGIKGPKYKSIKTLVANIFGCMVTDVSKELLDGPENKWLAEMLDQELKAQWGCWVTSHARKALIDVVLKLGIDYWLYSDTDSVYYIYDSYSAAIIEDINREQREKNRKMCEEYGLDFDIFGNLGCWCDDGLNIIHFKTLGPKAYMYLTAEGKYVFKMSGVPEHFFWEAYERKYGKDNRKEDLVFDFFEKNTDITYTRSVISYIDEETTEVINGMVMTSKSGSIIKKEIIKGTLGNISELCAIEANAKLEEDSRV